LKSKTTARFRALYSALPAEAQRQVKVAYSHFTRNHRHNSLKFKRADPSNTDLYSVRVGAHYRAIGSLDGDTVTWTWVGTHEEYNSIIHRR